MKAPAPAPASTPQGGGGAWRSGSTSENLAELYTPVMSILTADRGEQMNRVAEMMLEIVEARDAEELAANGMFELAPDHPGAVALDTKYKPLIAMLMAKRSVQMEVARGFQRQVRDSRDGENMQARGVGGLQPGHPRPFLTAGDAALLAPQGGVPATGGTALAAPKGGPARDRKGA